MYFDNVKISKIEEETGFHRNTIYKLAKKCITLDENGLPFGYKALIPYKRIKTYTRVDENKEKATFNEKERLKRQKIVK